MRFQVHVRIDSSITDRCRAIWRHMINGRSKADDFSKTFLILSTYTYTQTHATHSGHNTNLKYLPEIFKRYHSTEFQFLEKSTIIQIYFLKKRTKKFLNLDNAIIYKIYCITAQYT